MKVKWKRKESGLSGLSIALPNDREKDLSPRRAAPDGASCEKHPRIRPNLVVARPSGEPYGRLQGNRGTLASLGSPSGAGRGVWGVGSPFKRLANSARPLATASRLGFASGYPR